MAPDKLKKSQGLEGEFLAAYDNCAGRIFRHIWFRVSHKTVAQDLTSETFFRAWQFLRQGNQIKNFKSFFYRVAQNLIIDYYRQKGKECLSLETVIDFRLPGDEAPPADRIDQAMALKQVLKHLAELPEGYQQILTYRYLDDLSISNIKEITGKSAVNIYVIIHRGLKMLKEKSKSIILN